MKPLALLGASGHGRVVADAALLAGWASVHFFDDAWPMRASAGPWSVIGTTVELVHARADYAGAVVAIGHGATRLRKQQELSAAGIPATSVVHPSATISPFAEIGAGSVICAGAVIGAFARLGVGCIVNTGASVDHDCELGDGVHVCPGARLGGGVRVGALGWVGIGASVIQSLSIGAGTIVGAGSVVIGDLAAGLTVVGVPARPIRC